MLWRIIPTGSIHTHDHERNYNEIFICSRVWLILQQIKTSLNGISWCDYYYYHEENILVWNLLVWYPSTFIDFQFNEILSHIVCLISCGTWYDYYSLCLLLLSLILIFYYIAISYDKFMLSLSICYYLLHRQYYPEWHAIRSSIFPTY